MNDITQLANHLRSETRALGARFDPEVLAATKNIFRSHLDLSPAKFESLDHSYGPHARHRLDVYKNGESSRAVVVFVHGGGFVAGDKNSDGTYYANVGRWLARQGLAAVLPNYRLAPGDAWPAGARDVASVLSWVQQKKGVLGGDQAPVFVWGQSAGASHVASWLFDEAARGGACAPVTGVMLMSGFYQAVAPLPAGPKAYFGADTGLYEARSPLSHVQALHVPLWVSLAEFDPAAMAQQTYALARAVTQANGRGPDFHFFRGHNHVSTVQSIGSPVDDVGTEVLRFISASQGDVS